MEGIVDARSLAGWKGKESAMQIQIVSGAMLLAQEFPEFHLLYAIPNGDWRGMATARRLKAEGLRPGMPDLCLPVARGGYHGLYMELKTATGRLRPDQQTVMQDLARQGYFVCLCNYPAEALRIMRDYLMECFERNAKVEQPGHE